MTITGYPEAVRGVGAVTVRAAELVVNCLADETATSSVPAEDVAALATHLVLRRLPAGQVALPAGLRPDGVWIVQSGAIELTARVGRRPVVAQVLRDGDVFGDIPLLIDREFPYQLRALRATTCFWLSAQDFLRLLADRPAISRLWLRSCAARYIDNQSRMLGLLDGSLAQRTAMLLLGESRAGVVDLPQTILADMIGSPRPSLNRVLRAFQQQGMISLNYGRIHILDELRLRHLAQNVDTSAMSR